MCVIQDSHTVIFHKAEDPSSDINSSLITIWLCSFTVIFGRINEIQTTAFPEVISSTTICIKSEPYWQVLNKYYFLYWACSPLLVFKAHEVSLQSSGLCSTTLGDVLPWMFTAHIFAVMSLLHCDSPRSI